MNQTIFIKLIYGKGVISVIAVMLMIGCINDVKISQQTIKDTQPSGEIQTILRNGETRSYVIYIPSSYQEDKPMPLMINFHGFGGNASDYAQNIGEYNGLNTTANENNFIVVYPQAVIGPKGSTYWTPGDNGIENIIGVPDSTLKHFIDECLKNNNSIIATREEEAIGIAAGMSLSKSNSLVFMQNAGFANSLSTITSLVQLYEIPMILLIGWRGFLKDDAPEHEKIGEIQPELINIIGLESKIINDKNFKNVCDWAVMKLKKKKTIALIIKRDFLA